MEQQKERSVCKYEYVRALPTEGIKRKCTRKKVNSKVGVRTSMSVLSPSLCPSDALQNSASALFTCMIERCVMVR